MAKQPTNKAELKYIRSGLAKNWQFVIGGLIIFVLGVWVGGQVI